MCWALENFNKCKEKDPVKEKISLYGWTVAVISLLSASGGLMEVLWLFSSHQTHDERVSSWRSEPSSSLREKAVGNKGRKKTSPRWCERSFRPSRKARVFKRQSVSVLGVIWLSIHACLFRVSSYDWNMSKLPIAAFYPNGSPSFFDAHNRSGMTQNRTIPAIILADSNDVPSPVTLCVDGVLLWLLLAWLTAGTAAIITLIIKSCRNR